MKGYAWPDWPLYHATAATDAILDLGFKSRAQLALASSTGKETHIVGGGTSHAISFTLDQRVGRAILIGLKVMSRLLTGELPLSELVALGYEQAPVGTQDIVEGYGLTPEFLERFDDGLRPWRLGSTLLGKTPGFDKLDPSVLVERRVEAEELEPLNHSHWREMDVVPEGATEVYALYFSGGASRPFRVYGWAPAESVIAAQRYGRDEHPRGVYIEMYKRMLAMSDNVYDPLFFNTSLSALESIREDQLSILVAHCDADWLCANPESASRLGLPDLRQGSWGYDWSRTCQNHMDRGGEGKYHGTLPSGFDPPDVEDTVAYLGRAMAEIRVYNPELIHDVHVYENLADAEWDVDQEDPDSVIVYPHFRSRGN